jgi:hypothetical protein
VGARLGGTAAKWQSGSAATRERGQAGYALGSTFGKRAMLYGSGVLDGDDDCPLPRAPAAMSEAFGSFRKFSKGPSGRFRRGCAGSVQKFPKGPSGRFRRGCAEGFQKLLI